MRLVSLLRCGRLGLGLRRDHLEPQPARVRVGAELDCVAVRDGLVRARVRVRARARVRVGAKVLVRVRLGSGWGGLREQRARERRLELALHDALERARAVLRVVAQVGERVEGLVRVRVRGRVRLGLGLGLG